MIIFSESCTKMETMSSQWSRKIFVDFIFGDLKKLPLNCIVSCPPSETGCSNVNATYIPCEICITFFIHTLVTLTAQWLSGHAFPSQRGVRSDSCAMWTFHQHAKLVNPPQSLAVQTFSLSLKQIATVLTKLSLSDHHDLLNHAYTYTEANGRFVLSKS